MKRVARFFEDKFVSVFAPEGEDQELADDFDRDLFGKSIKHWRFQVFCRHLKYINIIIIYSEYICMHATESEST